MPPRGGGTFTDEQIRAAVATGGFTDSAAEKLLADILIKRRDAIGRVYYTRVNPLVRFALDESGVLTFENPAVTARFAAEPATGYQATWHQFDNATRESTPIGSATAGTTGRIEAPAGLPHADGAFVRVAVAAVEPPHAPWAAPVDVYFKRQAGRWVLVGLERLP
jgi:hypothetical protein